MKRGRASRTAEMVCMGRAVAHGTRIVPRFSDPTALELLPAAARVRVERFLAATSPPRGLRDRIEHGYLDRQSKIMAARTVEIDDAIRAGAAPQLVILGAGLDGRAWRMPELEDTVVFEVDHPDSQRDKRARVVALSPTARDIRFVPVDFTRDSLDAALASAGHDPERPTLWIWEGVVMYLTRPDIESTLAVVAARSAPGSRLVVAYHTRALFLLVIGLVTRRVGEPLRSVLSTAEMRDMLAGRGFRVVRDADVGAIAGAISPRLGREVGFIRHLRIATAERR